MTDRDEQSGESPLTGLPLELPPPPALEQRIVASLASRRLLRQGPRRRLWLPVAASLAGLFAGWLLRGVPRPVSSGPEEAGLYLLLLSNDPTAGPSFEERVRLYADWARRLRQQGQLEVAEKLEDRGVVVDAELTGPPRPRDADASDPSGFYLVRAGSLDEAVALARESPHVRLGGRVTVRPIDPV
jgi:hypothetical protein